MVLFRFVLCVILVSCSFQPSPSSVKNTRARYVICGKLFDSVAGRWLEKQVLKIEGKKIVALNPDFIPSGADVLDFSSSYIIPGLVDSHTHLFLADMTYGQDFSKGLLDYFLKNDSHKRELLGLQRGRSLLQHGFTSVRDLGNFGEVDVHDFKEAHKLEQIPRIYTSGPGFTPLLGQFPPESDPRLVSKEYTIIGLHPSEYVGKGRHEKVDLIKIYADEDPNGTITPLETLKEWVAYAHALGYKVAVHAAITKSIDHAIAAQADSIEHGTYVTEAQLKEMADKKIILVPTHVDSLFLSPELKDIRRSFAEEHAKLTCKNMKRAKVHRVEVAFGTDNFFSLEHKGISFGQATLTVLLESEKCGTSRADVLRSATYLAAKTIGKEDEIGRLSKNAYADFIVLRDDPLKDLKTLTNPVKVFKDGGEVE